MDDGFIPWPSIADINIFKDLLNNLDENIEFTLEKATKYASEDGNTMQKLNFLDITVILHHNGKIETDIFYKETNNHDYLPYDSQHPEHIKKNIPYNLAKRIIVFCSDSNTERNRLSELESWLLRCNYPRNVIRKAFHNAKLQGPAPKPKKSNTIPFVTTFTSNYNCGNIPKISERLLKNSTSERTKNIFKDTRTVLAQKQPKNLLRQLTIAKFDTTPNDVIASGMFKCKDKRCVLCRDYIVECASFMTSSNVEWQIRCKITCNIYFHIFSYIFLSVYVAIMKLTQEKQTIAGTA